MSQASVAELTPLTSCQSYTGTSVDSCRCHLGTAEMLSRHRSDTLPPKLLGHLAEGGGADSVGPFMLRLSGAGFAHCAPGPETSVWPGAQTLYLGGWAETYSMSHSGLLLKDQEKHSPCAFFGPHLNGQPFRFQRFSSLLTLGLSCGVFLLHSQYLFPWNTKKKKKIFEQTPTMWEAVSSSADQYCVDCFVLHLLVFPNVSPHVLACCTVLSFWHICKCLLSMCSG